MIQPLVELYGGCVVVLKAAAARHSLVARVDVDALVVDGDGVDGVVLAVDQRRAVQRAADLGRGRVVASETEAPKYSMFATLVVSG